MQRNQDYYLQDSDEITLKDIFKAAQYYLYFWPYFVASIILAFMSAFLTLRYTNNVFQTDAQVQIKKGDSDPTSFLTERAESLLNFDKVNLENDIAIITSNKLIGQVVDRLQLQTRVYRQGRVKTGLITKGDYPFQLEPTEEGVSRFFEFTVETNSDRSVIKLDSIASSLNKGKQFSSEFFNLWPKDTLFTQEGSYTITHVSRQEAIENLLSNLEVRAASKDGEVVNLTYKGPNKDINESILNTLIQVLKEDQVADKRAISEVSIEFIDDRLKGLTQSIDTISEKTIAFQSASGVFDPTLQTGNALTNIIKGQEQALSLGIQREIASGLKDNLTSQESFELLPANVGLESESVNALVENYNEVIIQRNNLLMSATKQSPVVIQLTDQLRNTREAIIRGIDHYIDGLNISLSRYDELQRQTQSAVASLPAKENTLRGFSRNFKIVEELYLFLLQRKEEASISYISALPNVKVLSDAVTQTQPISPKPLAVYGIGILAGLLVPFVILFIANVTDTKINTRDDLSNGLPGYAIVGEIPFEEDESKVDNPRGTIAEATRVMRSNLAFLLHAEGPMVMASTSSIKGEGKSFVSYNLAHSYAALGKKVLLIGADLRNPQLHNRLDIKRSGQGLSTYLKNPSEVLVSDMISVRADDPVHYLLSGAIPPNPSELLARPSFGVLVEELKGQYDVVVIDSAPLMLVSDTSPILPLCDLVVYVSRAQYTDKNVFPFIKDLQKRKNMPPLAMVLNGIIAGPQSYYKYGYKYRYSYRYKYNYGYGYGYGADKKEA